MSCNNSVSTDANCTGFKRKYHRIAGYGLGVLLQMGRRLEIKLGRKPTLAELSAGYAAFFKRATDIWRPRRRA